MPNKNTLALIATGFIAFGFFISGILNILDYFIVKALLLLAFGVLALYLLIVILKPSKTS